jgi:hypothetical protein
MIDISNLGQAEPAPADVSNVEFLRAIFGPDFYRVHVTAHGLDPSNVPSDECRCWSGKHFVDYGFELPAMTNQYFCISLFHGTQRRTSLFDRCHCIVVDDVAEKIDVNLMLGMPAPSWILETSPGSQQWGYILLEAERRAAVVNAVVGGLIERFGKDPGMAGVTRYVRLPEGSNLKVSKMLDGSPFDCRLLFWNPDNRYDLVWLAEAMGVDLQRRKAWREDRIVPGVAWGQSSVSMLDHPIFDVGAVPVLRERTPGVYVVRCPWAEEHGARSESGAAMFIRRDGSLGFKCHHGHCVGRDGVDFVKYVCSVVPEFKDCYDAFMFKCLLGVRRSMFVEPLEGSYTNSCVITLPF